MVFTQNASAAVVVDNKPLGYECGQKRCTAADLIHYPDPETTTITTRLSLKRSFLSALLSSRHSSPPVPPLSLSLVSGRSSSQLLLVLPLVPLTPRGSSEWTAFIPRFFYPWPLSGTLQYCPHVHPFIRTVTHRRRCQPRRATASSSGAVRVSCLAQGHLGTQLGRDGNRTSNLLVTSQPALRPEPHAGE